MKYRIGQGYDIHELAKGPNLVLGGVVIPFEKGLLGHSDADVLTHAIIDAVLGASGMGDIGGLFPDTDAKFKDANSVELLKTVWKTVSDKGYKIGNIDSTIIAQKPKLGPFMDQMGENLAAALETDRENINVKAKTNEKRDSVGMGEAMAAQAVALLIRER